MAIPSKEPDSLTAGDTLKFTKKVANYDPADSWVLTYALVNAGSLQTITASDNGDGAFLVNVAATTTKDWPAGSYAWQAYVTKATERFEVGRGHIVVKPNFATQTNGKDARAFAESMLAQVERDLANLDHLSSYSEGNVSVQRETRESLRIDWQFWKGEVARLRREEKIAAGMGTGRMILTRMPG